MVIFNSYVKLPEGSGFQDFPGIQIDVVYISESQRMRGRGPELCGWWFGPNVGGDQARRVFDVEIRGIP